MGLGFLLAGGVKESQGGDKVAWVVGLPAPVAQGSGGHHGGGLGINRLMILESELTVFY